MSAKITVAKSAGFCFGVNRAVTMCEELLKKGVKISTLGPIIHNTRVVNELEQKGCAAVDDPLDTPPGTSLVIRSHGVGADIYEKCEKERIALIDATCPFVAKIHEIVREYSEKGYGVLIAGDKNHPEVIGIVGHCASSAYIFSDIEGLKALSDPILLNKPCIMVAQTTFNLVNYNEYGNYAKKIYTNLLIFDTICGATRTRQQEAEQLAKCNDVCIVIGGKNSSNTKKLSDVCSKYAATYSIETKDELTKAMFCGVNAVGVTAGASTPSPLIEEVLIKMSEIINETVQDEDFDFEQALEDSCKLVRRGQRVEGVVTSIKPNEVVVDIGTKHTGFIPLDELSDDSTAKAEDLVKVGETLILIVTKVQDLEGFVTLSKKRIDSEKGMDDLVKGAEEGTIFDAYVSEIVNKGLVAMVQGVRVFIPASQATLRRGEQYEQLVHTHQKIKIIEADPKRRRAIGSIRAILDVENAAKRDEFWNSVEVGSRYSGAVKSLTSYGAFVDLGGVDGMIHISELSWGRIKSPAEILKVGDIVDVYVKDIDVENKKISLGYRKEEDNPWNAIQDYPIGSEFEAPVVSVTKFGAFVRILPGIDGLVHISEMSDEHVKDPADVVKVGDTVKVRLIGVDIDKKRVSLSMKPAENAEPTEPTAAAEE
ncbi:MAG: bifunctional 4-hydroxy-3-methylbut-2-enyl diphosphate reductase/30S ribosomal protein S1 [Oscillospiraceae bacterium]